MLASCASTDSALSPIAHRHGDLVHSHVASLAELNTHKHGEEKTTIKIADKKAVVSVKPAKASDIKPMGINGIGHKHHTHIEPKTGVEEVPC